LIQLSAFRGCLFVFVRILYYFSPFFCDSPSLPPSPVALYLCAWITISEVFALWAMVCTDFRRLPRFIFCFFFISLFFFTFFSVCPALMLIDLCRLQEGRGRLVSKMRVASLPGGEICHWRPTIESKWSESRVEFHTRKSNRNW